ncbi:hypothetical protein [Nannocystis radixulma]|uniref:Dickkopf N-terminal cysteine-rich domain-containing protein n=1 Tax=Nannocystis radixulma TaxID=2995305 RepID=A0ABT5B6Z0_9BACT|nr:hypothetical protein [Nannocystis radixulma]MDC0669883.1 hypothetical protein [Nannocystis radixulma]
MQRLVVAIVGAAWLTGCAPETGESESGATSTTTSTMGTSGDAPTSSTSGDAPTSSTTASSGDSTGEPAMCPEVEPIAEDEFAARFAEAICAQKEACGCSGGFACAGTFKQQFEAVQQYAIDNSLHFDPECAQQTLVSAVLHRACRLESDFEGPFAECGWVYDCPVFRGDAPTGGACDGEVEVDAGAYSNDCAHEDDYCHTIDTLTCGPTDSTPLELDDTCMTPEFAPLGICGEGLRCSLESLVCVPVVGEGEACGDFAMCDVDLLCEVGACQPRRPAGDACEHSGHCLSLTCEGGACRDEPVICLVDSPSDLLFSWTL